MPLYFVNGETLETLVVNWSTFEIAFSRVSELHFLFVEEWRRLYVLYKVAYFDSDILIFSILLVIIWQWDIFPMKVWKVLKGNCILWCLLMLKKLLNKHWWIILIVLKFILNCNCRLVFFYELTNMFTLMFIQVFHLKCFFAAKKSKCQNCNVRHILYLLTYLLPRLFRSYQLYLITLFYININREGI